MRKNNNFICTRCEQINPDMILVEKWNKGDSQPYRIEVLLLQNKENKDYYYQIDIININKKIGKTLLHHMCGVCRQSIKKVDKDKYLSFVKGLKGQRRNK